jgi:hypothetical protein
MRNHRVDAVTLSQSNKGINMIHGIYLKSKPKNKWHLVSQTISAEMANMEVEAFKKQAIEEGNEQAEVAIQVFDSAFFIPQFLNELKDRKVQYN